MDGRARRQKEHPMYASRLESNWGWVVARGIAGIIFGVLALAWPGATLISLLLVFAVFAFFEGIANVISAIVGGREGEPRWGTLLLEGILSIAVAGLIVLSPARMALAFVWVLGFWAVMTGALRIGAAIRLRKTIEHEWLLALDGALSIGFGLVLLFRPMIGTLALIWWLGAYAIAFGIMTTIVGFRLRGHLASHQGPRRGLPTEGLHQAP
jgi:uncharacterized membrane protein HdeD (DUF308 family)